jgi:hypothetical protein
VRHALQQQGRGRPRGWVQTRSILCLLGVLCGGALGAGPGKQSPVPTTWDARKLASLELPLVRADRSAQHVSPEYYYRLAVRPIYKSYPI